MYAVSPAAAAAWRRLLSAICATAGVPVTVIDHPAPAPLEELWRRTDQGAVFMCGLPFSRTEPRPVLIAAPVPSPSDFNGRAEYWSDLVVRADSGFTAVEDTFGGRLAFTVPHSQSGCVAALSHFMAAHREAPTALPLFGEIIAPTITPLGALNAVIGGAADLAPIDSYAFRLLQEYRPDLTSQVRVVARTTPTPIPPLVASRAELSVPQAGFAATGFGSQGFAGTLAAVFTEAHRSAPLTALMEPLLLRRFVRPDPEAYDILRLGFEAALRYWGVHRLAAATHPAFAL
jgi:ABC-type phosphate/phosphonate transport system substrate-binding protein